MGKRGTIDRLKEIYEKLKGSERRSAEYILTHGKEIIQLSITELAERCDCAEATVFRVCQKVGCKGYQEFKIRLAQELIDPIENIHEDIKDNDNSAIVMHKVFNSTIISLQETMKQNTLSAMDAAVNILLNAEQINFFGMGISGALALDAYAKFLRTGKNCSYQNDSHLQVMIASKVKKNDAVIAISNSGSNKELIENVTLAKENGAKVITISSKVKSPLGKLADVTLVSYGREQELRSEASESRIAALTLLDCLFVQLCLKTKQDYYENLDKIRNAIAIKRI